jgi:hypothetical protein
MRNPVVRPRAALVRAAAILALSTVITPHSAEAQSTRDSDIRIGAQNEITAVYADTPPRIDGVLDDAVWATAHVVDSFVQLDPDEGQPPSHPSAMRIAYDENHLYFALSFFDAEPDLIRARNLERGGPNGNDDMFWLLIDTYDDNRNAYLFETNVLGTQDDAIITDESMSYSDWQWDGIYESEGRIADDGWHVELAIPFKTIRFENADELTMGVAIMRFLNRTGERSMWPFIPRRYSAGIFQVSQYASLKGIRNVERGRNVLIKPYIIGGAQETRVDPVTNAYVTDTQQDAGLDVKWAVNPNVTLDVTLNTDFAQVESDNVQLDLTRFNLFFPEKREFFLERAGLFQFGIPQDTETFFSRRIGISNDILAGARVVGQFDNLSIGLMNIQTRSNDILDAANNSVARIRADVFGRTTVGAILTNLEQGDRSNRAFGVDARKRFMGNSEVSAWFTDVRDTDPARSDAAGAVAATLRQADWRVGAAYTNIGRHFSPALGFVRRQDMKRYSVSAGYEPQVNGRFIRSYNVSASADLVDGQDNRKQSSDVNLHGSVRLRANDRVNVGFGRNYERLEQSFFIRPDAEITAGEYVSNSVSVGFRTDNSKFLSANGSYGYSDFFGGTRDRYQFSVGLRTGKYLNMETGISHSIFEIPIQNGSFDATTFSMNINAAYSRKLFAKALIQYDNFSGNLQANIRIDWIHSPGADLFLVFNTNYNFLDAEDQFDVRAATLNNRVGVAKLTYVIQL